MNPKEIADALKISESELKQVLLAIGIDELLNRASRYQSIYEWDNKAHLFAFHEPDKVVINASFLKEAYESYLAEYDESE